MPIERHALYFYDVASTSTSGQQAATSATCTCRIHVPGSVAASSKNLGKSPMVTWKLAAPSIKSLAGQQYELAYPVPDLVQPPSVKGGSLEPPWTGQDTATVTGIPRTPSSSSSSSSLPLDSPLSHSSSSDSIASLAHSEVSTISSYTSCSSLLDLDDSLPIPQQAATKKPSPSPACERPPSLLLPTAAVVAIPQPAPVLESILVAQTVQRKLRAPLAPVSKGMPFIPEDAAAKSPSLPPTHDVFEMNSRTSTLLRLDGFKAYLAAILEDFELFEQARKDFVDYWYTRFRDQEYLAVRFLTTKEYAALLPLDVTSSSPYTLQRLFAIFKRVTNDEARLWYSSRLRVASQKIDWKDRVGQTVQEVIPRIGSSSSRLEKDGTRRVRIEIPSDAKGPKASLLEIGAMELGIEAGIGRFFFV